MATMLRPAEWPPSTRKAASGFDLPERTVLSEEPEKSAEAIGMKATLQTMLEWPSSTCKQRPESTSQRRTVLSSEPERAGGHWGERHAQTLSEWPSNTPSSVRIDLPEARGVVVGAGESAEAIGVKGHTPGAIVVAFEHAQAAPGFDVPEAHGAVCGAGKSAEAIGVKGHA